MKIGLIEDFSGLHVSLKKALIDIGHDVSLISTGDGFKKLQNIDTQLRGYVPDFSLKDKAALIRNINSLVFNLKDYYSYVKKGKFDVIQFINPFFLPTPKKMPLSVYYTFFLKAINKLLFNGDYVKSMLVAGCDSFVNKAFLNDEYLNGVCERCVKFDYGISGPCPYSYYYDYNEWFVKNIDLVIPVGQGAYFNAYQDCASCYINMPVYLGDIDYQDNIVKGRVVFFHGINRVGFKGSDVIISALNKLKDKYPNDVDIMVVDRLPYDDYIKILYKSNVVVDQLFSSGLGMNSLLSMARGRVLVTSFNKAYFKDIPAFQIKSDKRSVDCLVDLFCKVLESRDKIQDIGANSRVYVERNHNAVSIARQLLDLWSD